MKTHHGAASFHFSSDLVSFFVTEEGGHLAPVLFRIGGREVSPYALAPWQPSEVDAGLPVLLKNLRGDFFCLPFGPRENARPHGDTANLPWSLVSRNKETLALKIRPSDLGAEVIKTLSVRPGQTAIYHEHRISGLVGNFSYGNHPILDLSNLEEGSARVSVSPFRWASVYPDWFSNPADGATQALEKGAVFTDLESVPLLCGGVTDLTRYPSRPGSDDLVMMVSEQSSASRPFAWSAVLMDGYLWFSLKNPDDFPATMFWLSNGGRSAAPWNSRHSSRIGIEDVCSHFCDGIDVSRQNKLSSLGIPTTRKFFPETPVTVRNLQAVVSVTETFGLVKSILPDGPGKVRITDEEGNAITTQIDWEFVCQKSTEA